MNSAVDGLGGVGVLATAYVVPSLALPVSLAFLALVVVAVRRGRIAGAWVAGIVAVVVMVGSFVLQGRSV